MRHPPRSLAVFRVSRDRRRRVPSDLDCAIGYVPATSIAQSRSPARLARPAAVAAGLDAIAVAAGLGAIAVVAGM